MHKHHRNNDSRIKTSRHLLNIQVENHGYCMAIMQVAYLGVMETPGRSSVKPRNETPDGSLSEGADLKHGQKCQFHCETT